MKSDLSYLAEKLDQAVRELATGNDDIRARVDRAYHCFWHIRINDFPQELQADRKEIDDHLTRLPGRQGYIIPDNLAAMTEADGQEIAHMIVSLNDAIARIHAQAP